MGWTDDHLNCFKINGRDYGVSHHGGMSFLDDPMEVCLADLKLRKNRKFIYEYDFGDCWEHQIRVEDILPEDSTFGYPVCLDGKRACPPEDAGGPLAYPGFLEGVSMLQFDLLRALRSILIEKDEKTGRIEEGQLGYDEFLWMHRFFNPERFDKKETDGFLEELYQKKGATLMDLDGAFQDILPDTQWH